MTGGFLSDRRIALKGLFASTLSLLLPGCESEEEKRQHAFLQDAEAHYHENIREIQKYAQLFGYRASNFCSDVFAKAIALEQEKRPAPKSDKDFSLYEADDTALHQRKDDLLQRISDFTDHALFLMSSEVPGATGLNPPPDLVAVAARQLKEMYEAGVTIITATTPARRNAGGDAVIDTIGVLYGEKVLSSPAVLTTDSKDKQSEMFQLIKLAYNDFLDSAYTDKVLHYYLFVGGPKISRQILSQDQLGEHVTPNGEIIESAVRISSKPCDPLDFKGLKSYASSAAVVEEPFLPSHD
ncbi:MAG: hypothetical protein KDI13_01390 [Alphaproteobacteria bacterium]|nr:hypothetical protein [Alphaproteobacteria bacterium]